MSEQVLRLFVSSPGDVAGERRRVDLVVERLNTEFEGRVRIETIRWETSYYSAHDTFQRQIPEAAECDVVVAIFRARLGSPLPPEFHALPSGEPYPSGTAYEVLSAIEVRKGGKRVPDVYVFKYPNAPSVTLDTPERSEIENQWSRLKQFFERWFRTSGGEFLAAFQDYTSTDDFAAKVEDCLRQWLEKRGFGAVDQTWDRVLQGTPFPGLPAFGETHQKVFFGRDLAISQSIARLREAATTPERLPFLLLIGASGSGKSSLLRAGLVPRLVLPGTIPDIDLWRTAIMIPGQDPFLALADSLFADTAIGAELRAGSFRTREMLAKQLATDPDVALAPIHDALAIAVEKRRTDTQFETARPARIALAIDQGERLFSETNPGLVDAFARLLAAFVQQDLAYVIFVLRSDAYAYFQRSDALVALREAGATFDLVPPTLAELEEIVTRPPALCRPSLEFESNGSFSLATQLVRDAKGGDALPLLQMTLARLYAAEEQRGDGVLRFADYRGMDAAVTETANEALNSVDAEAHAELPALVTQLVGDLTHDPISGAPVPVIAPLDRATFEGTSAARHALVDAFVARRLFAAEGDADRQRVRPVHEALLRIWPEAVAIVAEAGNLIRVRHTLRPIVDGWLEAPEDEKPKHLDISPALLSGAQDLVARFGADVPPTMQDFIAASVAAAAARAAREREDQERRIRDAERLATANRRIAQGAGVGLVLVSLLAGAAGWYWNVAQKQQKFAEEQRDRAERSLTIAVDAANGLIHDLGQKYKNSIGVSKATIKDILEQAVKLQTKLTGSGEVSDALKSSQIDALTETSAALLDLGDSNGALDTAENAHDIAAAMLEKRPDDHARQRVLALVQRRIGAADLALGRLSEADEAYANSIDIMEKLIKAEPSHAEWLLDTAMAADGYGRVALARQDPKRALLRFGGSLDLLKFLMTQAPKDVELRRELSLVYSEMGQTQVLLYSFPEAEAFLKSSLDLSQALATENVDDIEAQRSLAQSQTRLGQIQQQTGRNAEALQAFGSALPILKRLGSADPLNLEIQGELALEYRLMGDSYINIGNFGESRKSYDEAFAISKRLAAAAPGNSDWQSELSIEYGRVGSQVLDDGKTDEAIADFQTGYKIVDTLLDTSPNNELWRVNRGQMLSLIGDAFAKTAKTAEAEASYRESLQVRQDLVEGFPSDPFKKNDLMAVLLRLGDLLSETQRPQDAIPLFQQIVSICTDLNAKYPKNTLWRQKQEFAINRIGLAQLKMKAPADALVSFQNGFAIADDLSKTDPSNADFKVNLLFSCSHLGDTHALLNDRASALSDYSYCRDHLQEMVDANASNSAAARDLAVYENKVGDLLVLDGKLADGLQPYEAALDVMERLLSSAPQNAAWQADLTYTFGEVGKAGSLMMRSRDFNGALGAADFALARPGAPGWFHLMRANALMFLGRGDEAKAEHAGQRGTKPVEGKLWEDFVRANFAELKGKGLSDPLMDEILASFDTPK